MPTQLEKLRQKAAQFFKQEKFKDIIELLPDDVLEKHNDAELYAWRARAHYRIDENDNVIIYSQKAIDIDGTYWMGYLARGTVLSDNNEYDKAITDFNKAIELKPDDATAYNNRGNSWNNKNELDKAFADYNKAIELEPDDAFAYNNRGVFWDIKGEFDKAIADYTKAIELKLDFANPFRNRADIYYKKGEFEKALADYQKATELNRTFSFLEYNIKLIKEKLEEIKIIEASKAQPGDKDERKKIEQEIESIIKSIRESAKSGVTTVEHYTKMPVAEIYVKELWQKMQYSNAIYMNDPMEGKMLFEYLNDKTIEEAFGNGEKRTETSVYLGSFLPAEENDGEISHQDELVMWRTYGKDENSREAYGCSVVLNSDFFKVQTSKKDESAKADSSQELLNVVYIRTLKNHKEITNDPKGNIKKALDDLKEQLRNFINLRNKYQPKDDFYKDIENTIFKQLSTITYLFKSADYNFEHEVRVITYMPRNSDSIKAREISEPGKPPKKFYIESFNYILPYIKKIYLGPKVENHQQWSLYFDYEIRQRAIESEKEPDYPHKLNPSEIEILKSDCKFQ